jgi:hypothetical protein
MQGSRLNPEVEEAHQRRVPNSRSPDTRLAWRRPQRRIEQYNSTGAPQAPGKIDVFHQRKIGKPTNLLKNRAPHKQRLIAEQRPTQPIDTPDQWLSP